MRLRAHQFLFQQHKIFKMRSFITSAITAVLLVSAATAQTTATTDPITGQLGNATVVENNPPGPIYSAALPDRQFRNPDDPRGSVKGTLSATANPNGIGVAFQVNFENLPTSGGPFRKFKLPCLQINIVTHSSTSLSHPCFPRSF